jgi:hypothetical protein
MKGDIFIRNLLIIIVILLALNIILPILSNPATSYAANSIQYKVDSIVTGTIGALKTNDLEKLLNEYSKEGWNPISINYVEAKMGLGGKVLVVFKK